MRGFNSDPGRENERGAGGAIRAGQDPPAPSRTRLLHPSRRRHSCPPYHQGISRRGCPTESATPWNFLMKPGLSGVHARARLVPSRDSFMEWSWS